MNVFPWPVHGSWMATFVRGRHRYLLPAQPAGPTGDSPPSVVQGTLEQAAGAPIDVVVVQRPTELEGLARQWLHREPGRGVPAVYPEHSTADVARAAAFCLRQPPGREVRELVLAPSRGPSWP